MAQVPDRSARAGGTGAVEAFLDKAASLPAPAEGRGRLIFALDATMSRQPTWDIAQGLQQGMFEATRNLGGLDVQLVYFRGLMECRASRFVSQGAGLADMMSKIDCRGGATQIGKVLKHARDEAKRAKVGALVFVGDAMEENVDRLCVIAGELGLMGVKAFMFHEGADVQAGAAFKEIARLTGGAYAAFDSNAPQRLAALLGAAAAYAAGGFAALEAQAGQGNSSARLLIEQMGGKGADVPQLLIALAILIIAYQAVRLFARTPPAVLARLIRGAGGLSALGAGLFLLLRGSFPLAAAAGALGAWMLGLAKSPGGWNFSWPRRSDGMSRVRSAMIEMELDHATGAMRGTILAGPDEGRSLDTMTRPACERLYRQCLADDPDGARLLEAYLDRRFPGWRQAGQGEGDAGRAGAGRSRRDAAMSEDEAYEVLGLRKGASREDVSRAHRTLMKKLHPDQGGSTDLAARVNEAKDVLMRRHH